MEYIKKFREIDLFHLTSFFGLDFFKFSGPLCHLISCLFTIFNIFTILLLFVSLGEMQRSEGTVEINGSLGYCAQQAWIQNATLKDNILFHKKLDKDRYNQVLEACALKSDLQTLPAGDATEIGEKGINLSGGQKHRVALARVVYR